MPEGGFLIKFDGKIISRCYSVSFDYDQWQYTVNDSEKNDLPVSLRKIEIKIEGE